ncbi:hypothetical protein K0M31_002260 [Melipona bicolor]|uniref:Uncharacterized protein n=1 Tax=Melipona bicolor TaxID=60889 RepID=A0AA40KYN8_9HYME|nr:hypothetical protein K0M31_002260 [Melipona bicolor]
MRYSNIRIFVIRQSSFIIALIRVEINNTKDITYKDAAIGEQSICEGAQKSKSKQVVLKKWDRLPKIAPCGKADDREKKEWILRHLRQRSETKRSDGAGSDNYLSEEGAEDTDEMEKAVVEQSNGARKINNSIEAEETGMVESGGRKETEFGDVCTRRKIEQLMSNLERKVETIERKERRHNIVVSSLQLVTHKEENVVEVILKSQLDIYARVKKVIDLRKTNNNESNSW